LPAPAAMPTRSALGLASVVDPQASVDNASITRIEYRMLTFENAGRSTTRRSGRGRESDPLSASFHIMKLAVVRISPQARPDEEARIPVVLVTRAE